MPPTTRQQNAATSNHDLAELVNAVSELPAEFAARLEPLVQRVLERNRQRRRVLDQLQAAVGQLRQDVAYLVFDLEATRRERDQDRGPRG